MLLPGFAFFPINPRPAENRPFEAGAPVAMFDANMTIDLNDLVFEDDVTSDGRRFLIDTTGGTGSASTRG